jgi:hypothetical protein
MPYIECAEVERVKKIGLLDYLQQREPDELVRFGNRRQRGRSSVLCSLLTLVSSVFLGRF